MVEMRRRRKQPVEAKQATRTAKKRVPKFVAVKGPMYHPFAQVRIPVGGPGVLLDPDDSWLMSQIDAGLIVEI